MNELRHDSSLELRLDSRPPLTLEEARRLGIRGSSSDDPSGALRAQEAHDAGAVRPVVEVPIVRATMHVRIQASENEARELVDAIAGRLIDHPLVVDLDFGLDGIDGAVQ